MESERLVRGGVVEGTRHETPPPQRFLTRAPLAITPKTRIVAVASPDLEMANPIEDGWFLSDFYALNYLYKGQGASQVWLTAANPVHLLKTYGEYLHGNPYRERKVVLSEELIKANELTRPELVKPADMAQRFRREITKAAQAAVEEDGNILLLVFCHGIEGQFWLDGTADPASDTGRFTMNDLKEAVGPHVQLTLITTACYSGGWLVHPDVNATGMAAAKPGDVSTSWIASKSFGRYCGSVFASSLVKTMTSVGSALLPEGERQTGDDEPGSLQPQNATDVQTLTYNAFCNTMMDVLATDVYRNAQWQHFTFSAQNDDWEAAWTRRTGISPSRYEERWSRLVSRPYTGPPSDLDPSPLNAGGRVPPQRDSRSADMEELIASRATKRRVRQLAKMLQRTCPGKQNSPDENRRYTFLRRVVESGDPWQKIVNTRCHLYVVAQYQINLARLADRIVDAFHLPRPDNTECLMWNSQGPNGYHILSFAPSPEDDPYKDRWHDVYTRLLPNRMPGRSPEQGPEFRHFQLFIRTAVMMANKDREGTHALIDQIKAAVAEAQAESEQLLLEDPEVRQRGREWVRSLGRRARASLSPKKRPSLPVAPSQDSRRSLDDQDQWWPSSSSRHGPPMSQQPSHGSAASPHQDQTPLARRSSLRAGGGGGGGGRGGGRGLNERPPTSPGMILRTGASASAGANTQGMPQTHRRIPLTSAIFAGAPDLLPSSSPYHMEAMQRALSDEEMPGGSTHPSQRPDQEGRDKGNGKGKGKGKEPEDAEHPADSNPNFW